MWSCGDRDYLCVTILAHSSSACVLPAPSLPVPVVGVSGEYRTDEKREKQKLEDDPVVKADWDSEECSGSLNPAQ